MFSESFGPELQQAVMSDTSLHSKKHYRTYQQDDHSSAQVCETACQALAMSSELISQLRIKHDRMLVIVIIFRHTQQVPRME